MRYADHIKTRERTTVLAKGKHFLFLMGHPPCYCSGVSRVWQVGHVPWAPLRVFFINLLVPNVPIWDRPKTIFKIHFLK
jgi:hypothetical protein